MRRRRKFQMPDTTPIADIVFLLLIFFMLSSAFIVQPGIRLRLPKAVSSEIDLGRSVIIDISVSGALFVNDARVTREELPQALNIALASAKEKMAIIKADRKVPHGMVVEVMDMAKLSGAERLVIATEPKTGF
ncbi:MAG: biopolymer transporter ExbD [Elusimicrobiota bacterium]|nr:biopolymer transporter ExbD [Elusimicrobiota bacterium]